VGVGGVCACGRWAGGCEQIGGGGRVWGGGYAGGGGRGGGMRVVYREKSIKIKTSLNYGAPGINMGTAHHRTGKTHLRLPGVRMSLIRRKTNSQYTQLGGEELWGEKGLPEDAQKKKPALIVLHIKG